MDAKAYLTLFRAGSVKQVKIGNLLSCESIKSHQVDAHGFELLEDLHIESQWVGDAAGTKEQCKGKMAVIDR